MMRMRLWANGARVASLSALLLAGVAHGQQQPMPAEKDRTKEVIEVATKKVVTGAPVPAPARLDMTKRLAIEPSTANLVRNATAPAVDDGKFVNPQVEPGKVRWHPSFAAACEASAKSGKPVLLFHMMGKLDDQFC